MPRLPRRVLTLLLVTALAATAALAQSPPGSAVRPLPATEWASPDLFSRLWSFLASWTKNGCSVDPNGRCLPQGSRLVTGDNGCSVDPDGHCLPRTSSPLAGDNGCELDPSGARCPATTKNGCELDPDGRCVR